MYIWDSTIDLPLLKSNRMSRDDFFRSPSAQEFLRELRHEIQRVHRPPEQVVLDETDLCNLLRISKRHAADLRREGKLRFSKDGGKIYYKLSWVLEYIEAYRIDPPTSYLNRLKN